MKTFQEWLSETKEIQQVVFCEGSLSRMLSHTTQPFAIITAYKVENDDGTRRSLRQNIEKNRELRTALNSLKMGVHQLVGHWRECTATDEMGGQIPYDQCPPDKLVDSIERSYFVPKSPDIDQTSFEGLMADLGTDFHQNAVIVYDGENVKLIEMSGNVVNIGKGPVLGRISQAYSQHVLKTNVPFVFEGFQQLDGNMARQGASLSGLILPPINEKTHRINGRVLN